MRKVSFCEIWSFWSLFTRTPIGTFSLELFHIAYYINFIALEKCKKECNMIEIILVWGFCQLKIKITQFPDGFHLEFNFVSIIFFIFQTLSKTSKLSKDFLQFRT